MKPKLSPSTIAKINMKAGCYCEFLDLVDAVEKQKKKRKKKKS